MNGPTQKPAITFADYKEAESRLVSLREAAAEGFREAQAHGDLIAGERWREDLQRGLNEFKLFREKLPEDVRLLINAEKILESFSVSADGFVSLVIPGDVTDRGAIKALNTRFRELFPEKSNDAINETEALFLLGIGSEQRRGLGTPRTIKVLPVVPGTIHMSRDEQSEVLRKKGLVFANSLEQAFAAAAWACQRNEQAMFNGLHARGSAHRCGMFQFRDGRIVTEAFRDVVSDSELCASGSVLPL